eukprot:PLAT4943.1.p1 GENE.PLAT4943.1~~PLAT4943.1.p1  ORF type:complete len:389 (+),score=-119.35 PLAT4943.1:155-1321(+)
MFSTKPRKLTLTLFTYVALVLALSALSDAKGYAPVPQRRDHVDLNRMLKKRAPPPLIPVVGAGSNPDQISDTATGTGTTTAGAGTATTTGTGTTSRATTTSSETTTSATTASTSSSTSTSVSTSSLTFSSTLSSSSSTSLSSSSSSTSSSTTSSSSTQTSATTTAADTIAFTTSAPAGTTMNTPVNKGTRTSTVVAAASATDSGTTTPSGSASKVTKTTITVLAVIAACIGGTAIIWTVIRKWKFRPSAEFEDRMQPIDWQPTETTENGLPGHHRAMSNASHGSFQSGGHGDESNMAGRGMGGGYGATSDHGHGSSLQPIPDHDFTAVVPGGGYADLARGPSPQPPMQELARGPSLTRGNYDYGVPIHHQGGYQDAYDYNGAGAGPRY